MMMENVHVTLKVHRVARVHFRNTAREKRHLARLMQRRQPRVRDVVGFMDGVSIPIQSASDMNRQAMDYNGYHHDTMCNTYFVLLQQAKLFILL